MRVLVKQKLKCASIFKAILFIVGANMLLQYVTMMLLQHQHEKMARIHLHQDQE
jgi:hypothetical protein